MAKKPGRRSIAESNIVQLVSSTRPRIAAPSSLNAAERAVFSETVEGNGHLKVGDTLMIAAYAQTLVKVNKLARKTDTASVGAWEKCARVMLAMATKLRVTQQAATQRITSRQAAPATTRARYPACSSFWMNMMIDDDATSRVKRADLDPADAERCKKR